MLAKYLRYDILVIIGVYVILSVLYFMPIVIPYKIAFPVSLLLLLGFCRLPVKISIALLCSAVGDVCGATGLLMSQIVAFAIAHIFLIIYFNQCEKLKGSWLLYLIPVAVVVLFVFKYIIFNIQELVLQIGASIYCIIIGIMVLMALRQRCVLLKVGAIMFMVSDMVLSWNMYVSNLDFAIYVIMIPYYLAQLCLFFGPLKR